MTCTVSTLSGNGSPARQDSTKPTETSFFSPRGLCSLADNSILIADRSNHCLRDVNPQTGATQTAFECFRNDTRYPHDVTRTKQGDVFVTEEQSINQLDSIRSA